MEQEASVDKGERKSPRQQAENVHTRLIVASDEPTEDRLRETKPREDWGRETATGQDARTETEPRAGKVIFGMQPGLPYLPFLIMKDLRLVERHAAKAGMEDVAIEYKMIFGATPATTAVLSGEVTVMAMGVPAAIAVWDRTRDSRKVKVIGAVCAAPMYLNTTNPRVRSIEDFSRVDRIALPFIRTSTQAVVLQMAVSQRFGTRQYTELDDLTVGMTHAAATRHLLQKTGGITASFSSPPYQEYQQRSKAVQVRRVLSSFDVLGGPASFIVAVSDERFATERPEMFAAVYAALNEAQALIASNPPQAAEIFVRLTKDLDRKGTGAGRGAGVGPGAGNDSGATLDEVLIAAVNERARIMSLLMNPEVRFDVAPQRLMTFAKFMHSTGTIGRLPKEWQELCFEPVHKQSGS